jgi:hypothetical protein
MAIEMRRTDGHLYPVLYCDKCGGLIFDAAEGTVYCEDSDEGWGERPEVHFIHKRCARAWERIYEANWATVELADFVLDLGLNPKIKPPANPPAKRLIEMEDL